MARYADPEQTCQTYYSKKGDRGYPRSFDNIAEIKEAQIGTSLARNIFTIRFRYKIEIQSSLQNSSMARLTSSRMDLMIILQTR